MATSTSSTESLPVFAFNADGSRFAISTSPDSFDVYAAIPNSSSSSASPASDNASVSPTGSASSGTVVVSSASATVVSPTHIHHQKMRSLGVSQIALLDSTPICAVVGHHRISSDRSVSLIDMSARGGGGSNASNVLADLAFDTPVRKVLLCATRMVVVLETTLQLINLADLSLIARVPVTRPIAGKLGLCVLSSPPRMVVTQKDEDDCDEDSEDAAKDDDAAGKTNLDDDVEPSKKNKSTAKKKSAAAAATAAATFIDTREDPILAYPQSHEGALPTSGDVFFRSATTGEYLASASGDGSPVTALSLSADGKLLAVASQGGCSIRVFTAPSAVLRFSFRRGRWPADIFSMRFSPRADMIGVTSTRNTLHVFACKDTSTLESHSSVRHAIPPTSICTFVNPPVAETTTVQSKVLVLSFCGEVVQHSSLELSGSRLVVQNACGPQTLVQAHNDQ